jgi:predicted methyltransferase
MARDRNRKPLETLSFFQLRDDMRVLELLPGGGWYTRVLAPVLRENGEFYVAIGTNRVRDTLQGEDGFDHINVIELGLELPRTGPFNTRSVAEFDFGETDLDLVLTFRNMHNFTSEGRASINTAVFKSLKPGGLYGVIDHSLRHMEPMTAENRRRVDVVQIILEVQQAGFQLVDYSDLHYRPDDELRYEVGRKTVTGNTDRFTLLFRRP